MENVSVPLYDIIQIVLLLAACYCCKVYGFYQGVQDTVQTLIDQGVLKEEDITDDGEE
jgi:hypothetical protein